VLSLPAELTHRQANACLAQLVAGAQAESAAVVVDAAPLQRFDSSALAVLLELRRVCQAAGKRLAVQGMPAHLGDLAALYGIEGLLPQS
jgi:phospholipid transport system transporter-binding protein